MSYLADTNVLSESAPGRFGGLLEWLTANAATIYLSVITIAEVEAGIAKAAAKGAVRKAEVLSAWLHGIERSYGDRILPVDIEIARRAGRLRGRSIGAGFDPGPNDTLIAATAAHHGLIVLTRNVRHFVPLGVRAIDPTKRLPG